MGDLINSGESLPALIQRAGQRLLDARSSGEVLEARKQAKAALAMAKVVEAARETHADCLRIITRAESRMADEIDAGQKAGKLAPPHRKGKASAVPTLRDIGVRRDQLQEWREVRDAGEAVVEEAIQEALAEERTPTKADVMSRVRRGRPVKFEVVYEDVKIAAPFYPAPAREHEPAAELVEEEPPSQVDIAGEVAKELMDEVVLWIDIVGWRCGGDLCVEAKSSLKRAIDSGISRLRQFRQTLG
jgi:hypothetical protein